MIKKFSRITAFAVLVISTGYLIPANAESVDNTLEKQVQNTLINNMGNDAKDITVSSENGSITLHGWVQSNREESKARFIASTVPGVSNAYSAVHVFSSNNK